MRVRKILVHVLERIRVEDKNPDNYELVCSDKVCGSLWDACSGQVFCFAHNLTKSLAVAAAAGASDDDEHWHSAQQHLAERAGHAALLPTTTCSHRPAR